MLSKSTGMASLELILTSLLIVGVLSLMGISMQINELVKKFERLQSK